MSGDRLANVKVNAAFMPRGLRDDVLALVEIAEAARRVVANQIFIRYDNEADPMWDLKDALAKLDRPSSDRRADSGAAEEDA